MKNLRNKNQPPNADLVQVYLQSSWDIVTDVYAELANIQVVADAINAGTLDQFLTVDDIDTLAELNAILTDAQLGRFSTQGEAEAGTDNTTTMTPLRVAQALAALSENLVNNWAGNGPPTVTDDSNLGYSAGSVWIDVLATPHESYRCADPTVGAAVWLKTTLTVDELATVAVSGNSDDLTEGAIKLLLTVAERNKLGGIEALATADQTDAEIKTAYENLTTVVSQGEAEAGTSTTVRLWTAQRVAQAIAALGGGTGGLAAVIKNGNYTAVTGDFVFADTSAGIWTLQMPATPNLNDLVVCKDLLGTCGQSPVTIDGNGKNINGNLNAYLDTPFATMWLIYDGTEWKATVDGMMLQGPTEHMSFALSDETSDLSTGTAKLTTRTPYQFYVTSVRANVNTAPVGAAIQVDINESGISILDSPLTIDAGEKTSTTSVVTNPLGVAVVILGDDAELTFDLDQVGSTTPGKGLKVIITGYKVQL